MPVAIGASGVVGIALEANEGTYAAPTKFIPIQSEGLQWRQETVWRRPIKGHADIEGAAEGNARVEGTIDAEVFTDVLPYFLYASRGTITKGGAATDFTYTFKPSHAATPLKTLSIYTERAGEVFAYLGCVVASMEFTVNEGQLMMSMNIMGRDESTQTAASPTWDEEDFIGAGMYDIRIPAGAGTADTSADNFTLTMDNGAEPQYRLNPTSAGARFIAYGERQVSMSLDRDFESKAEFADFTALTAKAISLRAARSATRYIDFQMRSAIVDTYEVGLSGQGDLVRGSIQYMGVWDDTNTEALQIEVGTGEDITV